MRDIGEDEMEQSYTGAEGSLMGRRGDREGLRSALLPDFGGILEVFLCFVDGFDEMDEDVDIDVA